MARSYDNGLTWGGLITNPFAVTFFGIASGTSNVVAVGQGGLIATAGWNAALSKIIEQPYTPTFLNFGGATNVAFTFTIVGNRLKVMGKCTATAPAGGEARIGLPNGLISDAVLIPSLQVCGVGARSSTLGTGALQCLIESGVGYITLGFGDAGNPSLAKRNANAILANGESISVQFELPVSGYNT
jgi:hypothetical protein